MLYNQGQDIVERSNHTQRDAYKTKKGIKSPVNRLHNALLTFKFLNVNESGTTTIERHCIVEKCWIGSGSVLQVCFHIEIKTREGVTMGLRLCLFLQEIIKTDVVDTSKFIFIKVQQEHEKSLECFGCWHE